MERESSRKEGRVQTAGSFWRRRSQKLWRRSRNFGEVRNFESNYSTAQMKVREKRERKTRNGPCPSRVNPNSLPELGVLELEQERTGSKCWGKWREEGILQEK